jgi:hypothetical protein
MGFKTTGILALLLAILAGYIYLFEIRGWEQREMAEEAARRVAQIGKGGVTRLRLDVKGESISAVREGFMWRIVSPVETEADFDILEGLIHSAGILEKAGVAADSSQTGQSDFSLADYGLASPAVRLSFTDDSGNLEEVAFGDRSPTGAYYYVKTSDDDQIYLAESRFCYQFELTLMDLRDKRYVQFDPDRVRGIELKYGGREMIAVERDEIHWRMTAPVEDGGDDIGVGQFLTHLRDARIEEFADSDDLPAAGLDKPWFEITFYEGEDRKLNGIAFGNKTGSRAYRRYLAKSFGNDHIFAADSAFVHSLMDAGHTFRTRDVFGFNRHEVDRVEFVFPDSSLTFDRRAPEQWDVTSHSGHEIRGSKVEDFIDEVTALRAIDYVAESMDIDRKSVFETNGIRVRLFAQDHLLREVVVGSLGNHLFASTNDREQVLEIEKYFLQRIRDVRISPKSDATEG